MPIDHLTEFNIPAVEILLEQTQVTNIDLAITVGITGDDVRHITLDAANVTIRIIEVIVYVVGCFTPPATSITGVVKATAVIMRRCAQCLADVTVCITGVAVNMAAHLADGATPVTFAVAIVIVDMLNLTDNTTPVTVDVAGVVVNVDGYPHQATAITGRVASIVVGVGLCLTHQATAIASTITDTVIGVFFRLTGKITEITRAITDTVISVGCHTGDTTGVTVAVADVGVAVNRVTGGGAIITGGVTPIIVIMPGSRG